MKVIYEYGRLKLTVADTPSEEMILHLEKTVLGTPGGMRYAHTNTREKITQLTDTRFFELWRGDQIMGCIAILEEVVHVGVQEINSSYVRYFSINAPLRSKEVKLQSKKHPGAIHQAIEHVMNNPMLLNSNLTSENDPLLLYAYVEESNYKSRNMIASMGFSKSRGFQTLLFSRVSPRRKLLITELDPGHYESIKSKLAITLVPISDRRFSKHYAHIEHDEVKISASIVPIRWRVEEMPGFVGKLFLHILPKIPIINRLFTGKSFEFLAIEAFHIAPGMAQYLTPFLESVCAEFGYHKAIFWLDNQSHFYRFAVKQNLGWLHKLRKSTPAYVVTKCFNLTNEIKETLEKKEAYISADHST